MIFLVFVAGPLPLYLMASFARLRLCLARSLQSVAAALVEETRLQEKKDAAYDALRTASWRGCCETPCEREPGSHSFENVGAVGLFLGSWVDLACAVDLLPGTLNHHQNLGVTFGPWKPT